MSKDVKEKKNTSNLATAGFVLGIIALLGSWIPIINNASFIFGLIGCILALIGLIKSAKKTMPIIAIILCVISIAVTLSMQDQWGKAIDDVSNDLNESINDMSGTNTEKILNDYLDVQIGKLSIKTDEYGFTDSELTVQVKNKYTEKKSYSLTIEAVDDSGNRIMIDYIYANDLAANQSASYKVFP